MIRNTILAAALCLAACAQPEPQIRVDGDIIDHAVQHAQAQAGPHGRAAEPAEESAK